MTELTFNAKAQKIKIRHKSTGFDYEANRTSKQSAETPTSAFQKLVQLPQRRKWIPIEERKMLTSEWKRKLTVWKKQLGSFGEEEEQKHYQEKLIKRTTIHIKHNLNLQKKKEEGINALDLISIVRSKKKFIFLNKEDRNQETGHFFLQKFDLKKGREKMNLMKKSSKMQMKQFNRISEMTPLSEQSSLVSLISKFKFQNLKPSVEILENPIPEFKKTDKSLELFTPLCSELQHFKSFSKKKMCKTIIAKGWSQETASSPLSRKVSILTPWEMDNQENMRAFDFFQIEGPKG